MGKVTSLVEERCMVGRKCGWGSDKYGGGEVYGGEEMGWGSDK